MLLKPNFLSKFMSASLLLFTVGRLFHKPWMYQISNIWLSLLLSLCTSGVRPIRLVDQHDGRGCWKFCLKTTHRHFGSEGKTFWMKRFWRVTPILSIWLCTLELLQCECSNNLKLLLCALFDKTKLCTSDMTSDWPKVASQGRAEF